MPMFSSDRRVFGLGLMAAAYGYAFPAHASEPTKDDAVRMVEKAVAMHKAAGREKALAETNLKDGPFVKGELYVFAYDLGGTIVAHPVNPKLLGRNMLDVPDPDGKFYRKTIIELASTKGSGWVDYRYKNPETSKLESKTTYFRKHGDVIYCCGVYL